MIQILSKFIGLKQQVSVIVGRDCLTGCTCINNVENGRQQSG